MKTIRRDNVPLAAALMVSLALHLVLLGPLLAAAVMHAPVDDPARGLEASLLDTLEADASEPITLGREESIQSSLTWIGFDDYREHLAQLSETEQAQVVIESAGAESSAELEAMEAVEPIETAEAAPEPEEVVIVEVTAVEESSAPEPGAPEIAAALRALEMDLAPLGEIVTSAVEEADRLLDAARDELSRAWQALALARLRSTTRADDAPAREPTPTAPVPAAPPPGSPVERTGIPDQREADAMSVIDVDPSQWRLGQPIAGQGIEIETRRPEFFPWTLATRAPGNPTAVIAFDARGRVVNVRFERGSGVGDVDRAIMLAVYAWQARGARIDALADDAVLEIPMRFILVRRPR